MKHIKSYDELNEKINWKNPITMMYDEISSLFLKKLKSKIKNLSDESKINTIEIILKISEYNNENFKSISLLILGADLISVFLSDISMNYFVYPFLIYLIIKNILDSKSEFISKYRDDLLNKQEEIKNMTNED